jgi:CRP-like cAMP-binding protein
VQTLVGITIGPLGERLDAAIREEIVSRLTVRPLGPSEVIVSAGEAVPGLLLVGIGQLDLVADDKVVGMVGSGEFLFPTEVLGGGSAPTTARAGSGGALVLFGDRRIAQELLVTCPPLLEVFAGM